MKKHNKFILGVLLLVTLLIACSKEISDDVIEIFTIETSETIVDSFLEIPKAIELTIAADKAFVIGDFDLKYEITNGSGTVTIGDTETFEENTYIRLESLVNKIYYKGASSGSNTILVTIKDRNDREVTIELTYNVEDPGFNFKVIPTPVSGYIGGTIALDIDMTITSASNNITYETKYSVSGATDITGLGIVLIDGEALATDTYVTTPAEDFSWQFAGERLGPVKMIFTVKNNLGVEIHKDVEIAVTETPDFTFKANAMASTALINEGVTIDFIITETVGASTYIMNYITSNEGSLEYNGIVYEPGDDIEIEAGQTTGNYTGIDIAEHTIEFAVININTIPVQNNATVNLNYKEPDFEAPVIELNGNSEIIINAGEAFIDPGVTVSDNIDAVEDLVISIDGTVDINSPKTYSIKYTVADTSENEASVTRTVIVVDKELPVITIAGDDPLVFKIGSTLQYPNATAIDNVDGNLTDAIIVTDSVDQDKIGEYSITYTVTDSSMNIGTAIRKVIVIRDNPPIITLKNGPSVFNAVRGGVYVDPGATATDDLDGDITSQIKVNNEVKLTTPGDYKVTYTVTDSYDQTVSKVRNIEINDTEKPVVTLSSIGFQIKKGSVYVDPGGTVTDNVDNFTFDDVEILGLQDLDTNTPGLYTLDYIIEDTAGNISDLEIRLITVVE
ncbi:hypothetical protein GCM10022393_23380 [Aquimarina addita]|uniref:Cadherin domain-containing protein n=1 Tax=Aquimarina addita TaxID=870485 RepID=A0ABP6UM05_9FLAO